MHVRFLRVMKTWEWNQSSANEMDGEFGDRITLSKAVEHALGCVATKIGFVDIVVVCLYVCLKTVLIFQDLPAFFGWKLLMSWWGNKLMMFVKKNQLQR